MPSTHTRTRRMSAFAAALAFLPVTVLHAETKPLVVLVHRAPASPQANQNQDQANWSDIAASLGIDGYSSVSVALTDDLSAAAGRDKIQHLIAGMPGARILIVATDSTSETVSALVQSEAQKIKGVVLLSASATPASQPAVAGLPQYFVHLSSDKKLQKNLDATSSFAVPAQGSPMLAKTDDLAKVIESVSRRKEVAPALAATAPGGTPTTATVFNK